MDNVGSLLYFLFNFFLYGFIGWIIENLYSYYKQGHFQEDGFLNGPFKPMYAIAMSIIIEVSRFIDPNNIFALLFIMSSSADSSRIYYRNTYESIF